MPFGLKNDLSEFQKILNDFYNSYLKFSNVYINDVLVFSKSITEYCIHLQKKKLNIIKNELVVLALKIKFWGYNTYQWSITPIREIEFVDKSSKATKDKT